MEPASTPREHRRNSRRHAARRVTSAGKASGGHRPFATAPSSTAVSAATASASQESPTHGIGSETPSDGSGNHAWKKRRRWHHHTSNAATAATKSPHHSQQHSRQSQSSRQQQQLQPSQPQSAARTILAAAEDEEADHRNEGGRSRSASITSPLPAQTHPTGRREGTVAINVAVRCIDSNGLLSSKSLKDLLRQSGTYATEADTPCLGPSSQPTHMASQSGNPAAEGVVVGQQVLSPLLHFSLDSIATPNTFATFKADPKASRTLQGGGPTEGAQGAGPRTEGGADNHALAGLDDEDSMPPMYVESPYQYILRNFINGSFAFYNTAEERATFLQKCYMLCQQATEVLSKEPLMSCIYAPVYVFGDIHGNFEDLSYFLRSVLAFNDIHLSPCNILCLGDYVDRGPYSLECTMILLALKVEAPRKVTLLRGNHEDRVVCGDRRTYGSDCFLAQCQAIFGPVEGMKLFRAVTGVFRHLPLAAEIVVSNAPNRKPLLKPNEESEEPNVGYGVVESPETLVGSTNHQWKRATDQRHKSHMERILCTHGGIPRFNEPPRDRDMLAFLRSPEFPRLMTLFPNNPLVRDDPEAQLDGIDQETLQKAWYVMFDVMWSDPTADDSGANINEWGFGYNMRGNNVVSFSAKAVDTFLDAFQYTMLFRAHQEKAHGIRVSKSQKVLTIFSSSNYLGHGNGAGCVIVTPQGQVQLIVKTSR